ncbi:MAG: hypothetical protein AAFX93_08860 [Verrucomicrobiota bacterium]
MIQSPTSILTTASCLLLLTSSHADWTFRSLEIVLGNPDGTREVVHVEEPDEPIVIHLDQHVGPYMAFKVETSYEIEATWLTIQNVTAYDKDIPFVLPISFTEHGGWLAQPGEYDLTLELLTEAGNKESIVETKRFTLAVYDAQDMTRDYTTGRFGDAWGPKWHLIKPNPYSKDYLEPPVIAAAPVVTPTPAPLAAPTPPTPTPAAPTPSTPETATSTTNTLVAATADTQDGTFRDSGAAKWLIIIIFMGSLVAGGATFTIFQVSRRRRLDSLTNRALRDRKVIPIRPRSKPPRPDEQESA